MKLFAKRPIGIYLGTLVLAFIAAAQPSTAFAQDQSIDKSLRSVEVKGVGISAPPRFDVQRSCPGYGEALKEVLQRTLPYIDTPAEMRVRFVLEGNQVSAVKAQGGPFNYRTAVKRAVGTIPCVNDGQVNQQFTFVVVFKPDDGSGTEQRMAVTEAQPVVLARKD